MPRAQHVASMTPESKPSAGPSAATQGDVPREATRRSMIMNYIFFGVAIVMWLGIAAALVLNPGSLRDLWQSFRGMPLVAQGVGWLLLLPWMAAVWLWQVAWPVWLRLSLIVGVAWVNLYMFYPRPG